MNVRLSRDDPIEGCWVLANRNSPEGQQRLCTLTRTNWSEVPVRTVYDNRGGQGGGHASGQCSNVARI